MVSLELTKVMNCENMFRASLQPDMSTKQNAPHRHHYIPQFWTKRWRGNDGLVQRFTNPHQNKIVSLRKPTASVGWLDKLYEFPHFNNTLLNFEALFFKDLDQRTSNLFDNIESLPNPNLDEDETEILALFIMTMMHRKPSDIAAMREHSRRIFNEIREELRPSYSELRKEDDPDTVEEYEANQGVDAHLEHFSRLYRTAVLSERIARFLMNLNWRRLIIPETEFRLLLSDDPVIRTNGLAKDDGHLAFPLSPRIAVIGAYSETLLNRVFELQPKQLVKNMNTQAVESARHFVIDKDEAQSRFIQNRFGRSIRPTLSEQSL